MNVKKKFLSDLWVVLLDLVAVNASYYLALLIRFYVNSEFRPTVAYYLDDWARFAPWYSILAIAVFAAFKLYGGMWRYAGLNDMNRIILANACTTVVHVAGTLLFIRRMPITYYAIGGALQFILVATIRFSYRILLAEKKKLDRAEKVPVLVVGSGSLGRKVIRHLEENTPYRAVAIVGREAGKTLDGIPVVGMDQVASAMEKVKAVFIADQEFTAENREKIKRLMGDREYNDFTGALVNVSGMIPLSSLLTVADGPISVVIDGQRKTYASGRETLEDLKERYDVISIRHAEIDLRKSESSSMDAWMQDYKAVTGEDVSFF